MKTFMINLLAFGPVMSLVSLMLIIGCSSPSTPSTPEGQADHYDAKILRVGECNYVTMYVGSHTLVHAGDCPNPIHNCPCDTLPDTTQK